MKRPFAFARVPQSVMLIPLAPVLAVQAWRTVRRTPRLDPAGGDEHGFLRGANPGAGPAFRVVVIGESTAVGVGASRHAEALPGFLAEALRERTRRSVAWSVTGENGATARRITEIAGMTEITGGSAPDLVVVTAGINDLIRRRPLRRWAADVTELVGALRGRYAHAAVLVAGMPPVHRFPALPQPLRYVLGARARTMDRLMRAAAEAGGAVHAPMDEAMARDRGLFASDGFHPSSAGYRAWAQDLARAAAPPRHPRAAAAPRRGGSDAGPQWRADTARAVTRRPGRRRRLRGTRASTTARRLRDGRMRGGAV
ncbi:SGNH/GDSL hydrolase family protein [Actinomadura sp. BRA 177]|uniref:SGNH/GDSL hydrolase family protein n=1 Tax=Actinomadura sp. BRA 177 TaxID=2745202 RepID=UPI001595CA34|nr:SGNH/GDSL hydrolase family protein [Actinomadura sp. BRA 177]NVI88313.1 SGNH/GDSL hydrolase family protein [Actinomadura sp. BRA 177]